MLGQSAVERTPDQEIAQSPRRAYSPLPAASAHTCQVMTSPSARVHRLAVAVVEQAQLTHQPVTMALVRQVVGHSETSVSAEAIFRTARGREWVAAAPQRSESV